MFVTIQGEKSFRKQYNTYINWTWLGWSATLWSAKHQKVLLLNTEHGTEEQCCVKVDSKSWDRRAAFVENDCNPTHSHDHLPCTRGSVCRDRNESDLKWGMIVTCIQEENSFRKQYGTYIDWIWLGWSPILWSAKLQKVFWTLIMGLKSSVLLELILNRGTEEQHWMRVTVTPPHTPWMSPLHQWICSQR